MEGGGSVGGPAQGDCWCQDPKPCVVQLGFVLQIQDAATLPRVREIDSTCPELLYIQTQPLLACLFQHQQPLAGGLGCDPSIFKVLILKSPYQFLLPSPPPSPPLQPLSSGPQSCYIHIIYMEGKWRRSLPCSFLHKLCVFIIHQNMEHFLFQCHLPLISYASDMHVRNRMGVFLSTKNIRYAWIRVYLPK